jgi:hypothetical protein
MKKVGIIVGGIFLLASCGNSYEKTPEDWSTDVCNCLHENGVGSSKVDEKLKELKAYYSDDDYEMHDKATTLIGQDCPEALVY